MKLFGRSGGYYLFWTGFVYFWAGMYLAFTHAARPEIASAVWVLVLSLPFVIPPFGRWLNMSVDWDQKMFNLFGKKSKDEDNVVKFPGRAPGASSEPPAPPRPETEKEKEEPAKIFYRMGLTDNNRVAFSMGYSEITMNKTGCQQMIDQLKFYKSQLYDEGPLGGGPDGGEPVPVPEEVTNLKSKKAA